MIVGALVLPLNDRWHDRCIDDAKIGNAVNAALRVDNGMRRVGSHAAGAHGVIAVSTLRRTQESISASERIPFPRTEFLAANGFEGALCQYLTGQSHCLPQIAGVLGFRQIVEQIEGAAAGSTERRRTNPKLFGRIRSI